MSIKLKTLLTESVIDNYKTKDGEWNYAKIEQCSSDGDLVALLRYSELFSGTDAVKEACFMAMTNSSYVVVLNMYGTTIKVPIFDAVGIRLVEPNNKSFLFAKHPLTATRGQKQFLRSKLDISKVYHKQSILTSLSKTKSLLWSDLAKIKNEDLSIYIKQVIHNNMIHRTEEAVVGRILMYSDAEDPNPSGLFYKDEFEKSLKSGKLKKGMLQYQPFKKNLEF